MKPSLASRGLLPMLHLWTRNNRLLAAPSLGWVTLSHCYGGLGCAFASMPAGLSALQTMQKRRARKHQVPVSASGTCQAPSTSCRIRTQTSERPERYLVQCVRLPNRCGRSHSLCVLQALWLQLTLNCHCRTYQSSAASGLYG